MGKLNEKALARAYNKALTLEKAGQYDAAAKAYREALAIDPEDHGGAAVRLASMKRGQTPTKAPDAYVATLFDQHAEVFDKVLVEDLGYAVPMMLRTVLGEIAPGPHARMLDLGCGTGLAGVMMADMAGAITGVDLSENMLAMTDERGVYHDLYVAEAVQFLAEDEGEKWALIVATDVLPYLGALEDYFAHAAARLEKGGVLAFSSETLPEGDFEGSDFVVTPHQRFAHTDDYLRRLLAANGFSVLHFAPITVRHEEGLPIAGHLVVAKKA
jgi:predicted TPR repeat methyltransferase